MRAQEKLASWSNAQFEQIGLQKVPAGAQLSKCGGKIERSS